MSNVTLFKNYSATAAIPAFRLAKFSGTGTVTFATGPTDKIIGSSNEVSPASGERCDIARQDIAYVEAGAAIAQGDPITSDATGRGVTAAPSTGVNNRIVGFADEPAAAAGDIILYTIEPGFMQG